MTGRSWSTECRDRRGINATTVYCRDQSIDGPVGSIQAENSIIFNGNFWRGAIVDT